MGREWADQVHEWLEERRTDIETELGYTLNWGTHLRARNYRISAEHPGHITDDEETLAELREWMRDQLIAFDGVFAPIIQEIVDLDAHEPDTEDE